MSKFSSGLRIGRTAVLNSGTIQLSGGNSYASHAFEPGPTSGTTTGSTATLLVKGELGSGANASALQVDGKVAMNGNAVVRGVLSVDNAFVAADATLSSASFRLSHATALSSNTTIASSIDKMIYPINSALPIQITLPNASTSIGASLTLINVGTGSATIIAPNGYNGNTLSTSIQLEQHDILSVVAYNFWYVV